MSMHMAQECANVQMGQKFKGGFKSFPIAFHTFACEHFPHHYVCLWHPLSVLCVEATVVKRHFLGPHILQPVTKSWRMTTRRWVLLWVEKLRFATLHPLMKVGLVQRQLHLQALAGNIFAVAKKMRRTSCKAA